MSQETPNPGSGDTPDLAPAPTAETMAAWIAARAETAQLLTELAGALRVHGDATEARNAHHHGVVQLETLNRQLRAAIGVANFR